MLIKWRTTQKPQYQYISHDLAIILLYTYCYNSASLLSYNSPPAIVDTDTSSSHSEHHILSISKNCWYLGHSIKLSLIHPTNEEQLSILFINAYMYKTIIISVRVGGGMEGGSLREKEREERREREHMPNL